jgi:hypothetical protein
MKSILFNFHPDTFIKITQTNKRAVFEEQTPQAYSCIANVQGLILTDWLTYVISSGNTSCSELSTAEADPNT